MTELKDLLELWKQRQDLRSKWADVTKTEEYKLVMRIIEASAVETAEGVSEGMPESVIARRLFYQKGARWALWYMRHLSDPDPAPIVSEEPYQHITEDIS